MKGINCFCVAPATTSLDHYDEPPRTPRKKSSNNNNTKRKSSNQSRASHCSSTSNSSISRLPPCPRVSDPKVDALMMALPPEPRPSRCLRMSHPKTYSAIVNSMKATKGCRDWRSFDVFHPDEVDLTISAEEVARKRAADYERRLQLFAAHHSFSEDPSHCSPTREVDMIG